MVGTSVIVLGLNLSYRIRLSLSVLYFFLHLSFGGRLPCRQPISFFFFYSNSRANGKQTFTDFNRYISEKIYKKSKKQITTNIPVYSHSFLLFFLFKKINQLPGSQRFREEEGREKPLLDVSIRAPHHPIFRLDCWGGIVRGTQELIQGVIKEENERVEKDALPLPNSGGFLTQRRSTAGVGIVCEVLIV